MSTYCKIQFFSIAHGSWKDPSLWWHSEKDGTIKVSDICVVCCFLFSNSQFSLLPILQTKEAHMHADAVDVLRSIFDVCINAVFSSFLQFSHSGIVRL